MEIKLWLAQQMDEKKLSQAELSRRSRVPQPTIQRILSGETPDPRGSTVSKIEKALGANMQNTEQSSRFSVNQQESDYGNIGEKIALRGRVPIISYVQAGNWSEAMDTFVAGDADQWVETTYKAKKYTYALRVEGDSMEPRFPAGAILIVEPEEDAKSGSFVIVRQNGSDATFKQLIIDGGQKYLKPLNERYPIMLLREDAVMCGVVKKMEMDV